MCSFLVIHSSVYKYIHTKYMYSSIYVPGIHTVYIYIYVFFSRGETCLVRRCSADFFFPSVDFGFFRLQFSVGRFCLSPDYTMVGVITVTCFREAAIMADISLPGDTGAFMDYDREDPRDAREAGGGGGGDSLRKLRSQQSNARKKARAHSKSLRRQVGGVE